MERQSFLKTGVQVLKDWHHYQGHQLVRPVPFGVINPPRITPLLQLKCFEHVYEHIYLVVNINWTYHAKNSITDFIYQSCCELSVKICNDSQVSSLLLQSWSHALARDWPAIYVVNLSGSLIVRGSTNLIEYQRIFSDSHQFMEYVRDSSQLYENFVHFKTIAAPPNLWRSLPWTIMFSPNHDDVIKWKYFPRY